MLTFASAQETFEGELQSEMHLSEMTDADLAALLDRGRGPDAWAVPSTSQQTQEIPL